VFDLDTFLADLLAARAEAQPRLAVKEVVERAMSEPTSVAAALPPEKAELVRLHVSPELTVLKVVWAPGMDIRPHDHNTWASIGIYTGGEDNTFYRRSPEDGLTQSGGIEMRPTDVCLLGDDTIHQVHNPTAEHTGAIHVYGGDFFTIDRSEWSGPPYEEQPYDVERTLRSFEEANAPGAR
jgi:predicted metal-dependent enzyme (double-stranded beta helix superfamily)